MDPIDETPTEPVDYAALSVAYGGLLATLAFAARDREAHEPIGSAELVPLGLATFTLAHTVVHEKVETWVRAPFVAADNTAAQRPKGRRLRYAVGELLSCTRCMGTWGALGLVALRVARPPAGRTVISVLAAAGVNDLVQSSFCLLNTRERQARAEADRTTPGSS